MDHSLTKYVIHSKKEEESEEEIFKIVYKWGTQADIAEAYSNNTLNAGVMKQCFCSSLVGGHPPLPLPMGYLQAHSFHI